LPFPYAKILCPIEFDSNSGEALMHAAAIAVHSSATLHLLHVLQVNPLAAQGASEGFAGQQFMNRNCERRGFASKSMLRAYRRQLSGN
jgi:nucleotide-binding universal stress UspA family protein